MFSDLAVAGRAHSNPLGEGDAACNPLLYAVTAAAMAADPLDFPLQASSDAGKEFSAAAEASSAGEPLSFEQFLRAMLEVGQLRAREAEVARRAEGAEVKQAFSNPIVETVESE